MGGRHAPSAGLPRPAVVTRLVVESAMRRQRASSRCKAEEALPEALPEAFVSIGVGAQREGVVPSDVETVRTCPELLQGPSIALIHSSTA